MQNSLGPDAVSQLYSSMHGNLLSLKFLADGVNSLSAWTGRAS